MSDHTLPTRFCDEGIARLARCKLFVFDFDGTVYDEVRHFLTYGEEVARFLHGEHQQQQFLESVRWALAGAHQHYGAVYDLATSAFRERTDADSGRDDVMDIGDPWGLIAALARDAGIAADALQVAFTATRAQMASAAFEMAPIEGLRDAVLALKAQRRHVMLATNSPQVHTEDMLHKLQLDDVFDEVVFAAQKPQQITALFKRWLAEFGLRPACAVSIGDHFQNEIHPAIALGMQTVYIDAYIRRVRSDVTVQLDSPSALPDLLRAVVTMGRTAARDDAESAVPPPR